MTDAVKALRALYDACRWVPHEQYVLTMDEQIAIWDQAKAALAATEQNTGWRDISTAPKDWRNILLYPSPDGFNDDVVVGFFTEGMGNQWLTKQDALSEAEAVTPTKWQPLPPPPGEEVESDEVVFDDGFNPFMDGYDVDPDGPQNQAPPFRASDIERGLILLRTSSNAHGYTNCVVLTDRIEKLPAKGRQELARMMRNIATEIDGPSPLQARYDKLEAAAREACEQLKSLAYASHKATGRPLSKRPRTKLLQRPEKVRDNLLAVRKALRSALDGGE